MARVSFTLRSEATQLGSYLRYDEGVSGARTDYDSALRADGLQIAAPTFTSSSFSASSDCYNEVSLSWEIPIVDSTALTATPQVTGTVLVYSATGEPQTIGSGDILVESTNTFSFTHTGLPEGRWAYYTLFVHYQSTGGDDYYEQAASLPVLVPKDYGSTFALWERIPLFYRLQDTALGDDTWDADCFGGRIEAGTKVGPLLKFLSIFGFDMDRMRTMLDYQMVSNDPSLANTEHLDALSKQLGVGLLSSALGGQRLRALLHDIGVFRRSKGTSYGTEFFAQAAAGSDLDITQSTGQVKMYAQRVNHITVPKTGVGITTDRTALPTEVSSPIVFNRDPASGYLKNLGTGGTALDARYGNSTGVDSFDPALLTHTGLNYVYLPGLSLNGISLPDISISGDIDCQVLIAPTSWKSGTQSVYSKYNLTTGSLDRSFDFYLSPTGQLGLNYSLDNTTVSTAVSGVGGIVGFTDTQPGWIRFTRNATSGNINFYTAPFAGTAVLPVSTWSQLGTANIASTPGSLYNGTALFTAGGVISSFGTIGGNPMTGKFHLAALKVAGSFVHNVDFNTYLTSGSEVTVTTGGGQVATIYRATSGSKSVAVVRPTLLFGTDDYLELPDSPLLDFGASDSQTVLMMLRSWATPVPFGRLLDKADAAGLNGWTLQLKTDRTLFAQINDGTNTATRSSVSTLGASGTLSCAGMVVDRTAQTLTSVSGSTVSATTSTSLVGSVANAQVARVGTGAVAATYQDMEVLAAAVWRRALSATEIGLVNSHYSGSPTTASHALLAESVLWIDAALSANSSTISTYTSSSGTYTTAPAASVQGTPHVLLHLNAPIPVQLNDFVGFSVQSGVGTSAIKWARLVNAAGATMGIQTAPLTVDGVRSFEVRATSNASAGVWTNAYVEYLVDLSAVPSFGNGSLLAERNNLGLYFDGSTVRGGWLVDTTSISDYRWAGTANNSRSLYTEDYQRTKSVLNQVLFDILPITEVSKYTISSFNAVPGV